MREKGRERERGREKRKGVNLIPEEIADGVELREGGIPHEIR